MKQVGEINRANYALAKHHKELMRQKIDPRLIEQIQIADNPSLNYKNAFKSVYHDQLQRTVEFQQQRKQREIEQSYQMSKSNLVNNSSTQSSCYSYQRPLQNVTNQPNYRLGTSPAQKGFVDYHEDKIKRNQAFVNRNLDGGSAFFRAQDNYQRKKQQGLVVMKNILQQQLKTKQLDHLQATEMHQQEVQLFKENHNRQTNFEQSRKLDREGQRSRLRGEIKQQMQCQRSKKDRKSYFEYEHIARHNPITNPIEYHIDNPYILQRYQAKSYNYP